MENNLQCRIIRQGRKNGSGFTLIELLVVIAIIALLVSILLPSLQKAKDLAKASMCGSQTRNMALAYLLYREEWEMIPWGPYTDVRVGVGGGLYNLMVSVVEEMEDDGLDPVLAYICPANPGPYGEAGLPRGWWSNAYPYPGRKDPSFARFTNDDFVSLGYLDGRDLPEGWSAGEETQVRDKGLQVATHNNLSSEHAMLAEYTMSVSGPSWQGSWAWHHYETTVGGYNTAYGDAHIEWENLAEDWNGIDDLSKYPPTYVTWGWWNYWWKE